MKDSRMKVLATLVAMSMVALAAIASQAVAQSGPTLPAWMRPGIVVVYDSVSAFVRNGRYEQGIQSVMTTRVNSVADGVVNGATNVVIAGSGLGGTHNWACNAAGQCQTDATGLAGQFWVDIAHPTESTRGANGEVYRVVGQGPYSRNGQNWTAVTLEYSNPPTGVKLTTIYDAKTGLVLLHSEINPGEEVHAYFRTISGW